jgi:nitrogen fixation-related uncharacterized protein
MLIGFVLSVLVFMWALRNGQFNEQNRARFLPLEQDNQREVVPASRFNRFEPYLMLAIVCLGLLVSGAFVLMVLLKSGTING